MIGTTVIFKPGVIIGGKVEHNCGTSRAIGYFLEPMIALAPFAKNQMHCVLHGVTSDNVDVSVDNIKASTLPVLKHFGMLIGGEVKISKRGSLPLGGGQILFTCPTMRSLKPVKFCERGLVNKIRRTAYTTRISPQSATRTIEKAKSILKPLVNDVYIYTDILKGEESGKSPGFGLSLTAETSTGAVFSSEFVARSGDTPMSVGERAAKLLLKEIEEGGCVDLTCQWTTLLWMALNSEDVSEIFIGRLDPFT